MINHRSIDVLVVGAGPTGMTCAIELARRGVRVRIVEKRTAASTTSKALVVHARTLELLDIVELADELVAKGYTSPGIDFSASADKPLRADMHKLADETRFPYILILPQAETEAALERRLRREGVEVERGLTLASFSQGSDGVNARLEAEDGSTETVEAGWIIGADGPHSVVRQTLGLAFEGSPYAWTAFLGDVTLQGHEAEGGTEQHSSDRGLAFIVPFKDGTHRIVTIDQKYQGGPKRSELTIDDLQESISAILGKPVALSRPKWLTRWGADLKLAEAYAKGRAFIAGDAAHTHSPAGGQGMNTGIQDAFNLGWKLAAVVKGEAPLSLLDSYNAERHAQGRTILRISDLLLRSLLLHQPAARKVREVLFELAIPLPPVQHRLAMNLSGLGVHYHGDDGWTGRRMPDVELRSADGSAERLYARLRKGLGVLLVYVDPKSLHSHRDAIAGLVQGAAELQPTSVVVVLQNGLPQQHRFEGADTLVDYRGDVETKLGISPGRMLSIRPDGYIAADLATLDLADLARAYDRLAIPSAPPAGAERAVAIAQAATRGPARKRALAIAGLFAASGIAKLAGAKAMTRLFHGYGYGGKFMRFVGAWETAGASAVVLRQSRAAGGVALAALCAGAASTHAKSREPLKLVNALALLGVAASVVLAAKRGRHQGRPHGPARGLDLNGFREQKLPKPLPANRRQL